MGAQIADVLATVVPGIAVDGDGLGPFRLVSTLDEPASLREIDESWPTREIPEELVSLWMATCEARLFEDIEYGPWGLVILSPKACAARSAAERQARPGMLRRDDFVIGEFLGDSDQLVLAPSESGARRVLVSLPLYDRDDWYGVGTDVATFLASYLENRGEKYWEGPREAAPGAHQ